jgi:hypothetical protein
MIISGRAGAFTQADGLAGSPVTELQLGRVVRSDPYLRRMAAKKCYTQLSRQVRAFLSSPNLNIFTHSKNRLLTFTIGSRVSRR